MTKTTFIQIPLKTPVMPVPRLRQTIEDNAEAVAREHDIRAVVRYTPSNDIVQLYEGGPEKRSATTQPQNPGDEEAVVRFLWKPGAFSDGNSPVENGQLIEAFYEKAQQAVEAFLKRMESVGLSPGGVPSAIRNLVANLAQHPKVQEGVSLADLKNIAASLDKPYGQR